MKYQVILILIIIFWFLEGLTFAYISADPVLNEQYERERNYTIDDNSTRFYNTSDESDPNISSGGFLNSVLSLFILRLDENIFPSGLNTTIKFINWFLFFLLLMCVYRIANPLS